MYSYLLLWRLSSVVDSSVVAVYSQEIGDVLSSAMVHSGVWSTPSMAVDHCVRLINVIHFSFSSTFHCHYCLSNVCYHYLPTYVSLL